MGELHVEMCSTIWRILTRSFLPLGHHSLDFQCANVPEVASLQIRSLDRLGRAPLKVAERWHRVFEETPCLTS